MKTTEEVFAVKDGKATLSCTLSGDPKPKVVWMREEEVLKNSDNLKVSSQPNGVCSLDIIKVTSSEIGEYRCIATNEHGEASCRLYLDVAGEMCGVSTFGSWKIPVATSSNIAPCPVSFIKHRPSMNLIQNWI